MKVFPSIVQSVVAGQKHRIGFSSGGGVVGAPAWVPPIGFFADIPMINNPADLVPAIYAGDNYAMRGAFDVWGGSAILRDFSALGAQAYYSGGHENSAGQTNTSLVSVCDFTTLTWYVRNVPSMANPVNTFDPVTWTAPDGQPYCFHTYQGLQEFPAAWGGGPKGSLVAITRPGSHVTVIDVSQTTLGYSTLPVNQYENAVPNIVRMNANGIGLNLPATVRDDKRQGWWLSNSNQPVDYILFIHKSGLVKQYRAVMAGCDDSLVIIPSRDLLVTIGGGYEGGPYGNQFYRSMAIYDLNAITTSYLPLQTSTTGPVPTRGPGYDYNPGANEYHSPDKAGLQWVEELGCIVGLDTSVTPPQIYKLTPPASGNWTTEQWVWSTVAVAHWPSDTAGQTTLQRPENDAWSKFRWVPTLGAFTYCSAANKKPQVIRIS